MMNYNIGLCKHVHRPGHLLSLDRHHAWQSQDPTLDICSNFMKKAIYLLFCILLKKMQLFQSFIQTWLNSAQLGSAWLSSAQLGSAWLGSARLSLA